MFLVATVRLAPLTVDFDDSDQVPRVPFEQRRDVPEEASTLNREQRGEDPDLDWVEAQAHRSEIAARDPWPGVVPPAVEPLREVARLRRDGRQVLPAPGLELAALEAVALADVRVVVVGLDPYPNPAHAMGLAFSVPPEATPLPLALRSIHAAILWEGLGPDGGPGLSGDLSGWARQGVLLLNRALTYDKQSGSGGHLPIWQSWTDEVIRAVSDGPRPVVFALWGRKAERVLPLIDQTRHRVVTARHPAAHLKVHRQEFITSGTFRSINANLVEPIDWSV